LKKLLVALGLVIVAIATYVFIDLKSDSACCQREPASGPATYESLTASEKQKVIWDKIQKTEYRELPKNCKFGFSQLIGLASQEISLKGDRFSDFAPKGWVKYLHRRAAIAKVKILPKSGKYTGVFQGADYGLLRLSLTYATSTTRPVAPGLALKVLRNGTAAANISALVSLQGQGQDFNFFRHPMSNIVPIGNGFGQSMVHRIFSSVSKYPEELAVKDLAAVDTAGVKAEKVTSPRQIFFVPVPGIGGASDEHDVREDFMKIKSGTAVYRIFALPAKYAGFDYAKYSANLAVEFLKESEHIADIVTTSEFVASEFGDDGIFFRHELRP